MAEHTRVTFCIIRGIPIIDGHTSDKYRYMNPPQDVLDDIVGTVAVLNMELCDSLTS